MYKEKKGLSEVVTMAIVVGLAVVLVVSVGIYLTRSVKEGTESGEETRQRIEIASKTSLKIKDVEIKNNNLRANIENSGSIDVEKILVKVIGEREEKDFEYPGAKVYETMRTYLDLSLLDVGVIEKIEAIPAVIFDNGKEAYFLEAKVQYKFSDFEKAQAINAPKEIVVWHFDTHKANASLIDEIADSGFITHVIINNKDFNEEPVPTQAALEKLNAVKEKGLIPIWERDLWFRRGNRSKELFAQPFIKNYTDGSIIYDKDYYIWFLNKLREEVDSLGVELVSVDAEPYENPNGLRDLINNFNQNNFTQLNMTTNEVIQTPGVLRAHYIYPVSVNSNRYHAYWALGKLGQNKITETTYKDCPCSGCILNGSLIEDFQLTGVWATADNNCYREAISCDLSLYNKTCSMGSTALWSAQSIFENHAFWFDVDRGLFIYTNNQSGEDFYFPRAIKEYCEDTINWINGKSPCEVYG